MARRARCTGRAWPAAGARATGDPAVLAAAADVLRQVRRAKSEAKVSMRAEVSGSPSSLRRPTLVRLAQDDLCARGQRRGVRLEHGETTAITVSLT